MTHIPDSRRARPRDGAVTACTICGVALVTARDLETTRCPQCQRYPVDWLWWKAEPAMYVTAYPDLALVNEHAALLADRYTITALAATDGHVKLGSTALGYPLAGPLAAAIANSRTEGAIIVAWMRKEVRQLPN